MRVVLDLEADGFLYQATTIWCGVAKDIDTGKVYRFGPDNLSELGPFLDKCSVLIGHNILDYDKPLLKKVLDYTPEKDVFIVDTYILDQMVSPDRKKHPRCSGNKGAHSLENFGCIFKRYKPAHEDWSQFSEDMLHRCEEDVEINYLAFNMINRQADIFNTRSVWYKPYKLEAAFAEVLVKQKRKGVLVDQDIMNKNIDYFTRSIDRIDRAVVPSLPKQIIIKEQKKDGEYGWNKKPFKGNGDLNQRTVNWCHTSGITDNSTIVGPFSRISIEDFNLGSRNQTVDYLLSQGWVPDDWNTKEDPVTGEKKRTSPKLSKDDSFNGVQGSLGKLVVRRTVLRHRRSQLEGLLKLIRDDGRITADASGITPTCRLKHKGVVNIPNPDSGSYYALRMRRPFIAPKGYKIIGCDAASCQLRNLCHHMQDDRYTEAVLNGDKDKGTDIHSLNMKATGLVHRSKAKNFIYGFLFGAGNAKIGAILGYSGDKAAREGKKFKDRYFKSFPKLKALIDKLETFFDQHGYIIGLDGRHIYPRSKHEILCYLLQSDEAILMKAATVYADRWIEQEGLSGEMVIHMHDEFQWEVKECDSKKVAELLEQGIVKAGEFFNMNIPMAGEAAIGDNWGETH